MISVLSLLVNLFVLNLTGIRGHNRSLVPLHGPQLHAIDHDFHLRGTVPSVPFFVNVPEDPFDSFRWPSFYDQQR